VTEKVLFLCVPNRTGLGHVLRLMSKKGYQNIHPENIVPARFSRILTGLGWRLKDRGFFDIPPWPDIAMKKEDFLKIPGWGRRGKGSEMRGREPLCILDYFSGKKPSMEQDMKKYAFMERAPWPVDRLWAHHRYFIFERGNGCSYPS